MEVDDQNQIIFIRAPKTGSTSVAELMREQNPMLVTGKERHITAVAARNLLAEPRNKYFRFGFVRNPFDWALSNFNHANGGAGSPWQRNTGIWFEKGCTFTEFVSKLWTDPLDWFIDQNGKVIVDRVFRLEDIDTEFGPWIRSIYGHDLSIPHTNKAGERPGKSAQHTDRTHRIIRQRSARLIGEFGY